MSANTEPQEQAEQATDKEVRASIEEAETDSYSRRGFLGRVGTATTATAAIAAGGHQVAPQFSPVGRARALPPAVLAAGIAAGVGARYYAGAYDGDDTENEYMSAREFEDHLDIYNDAREISEVTDDTLLASLKRDARNLGDAAREDAIIESYHAIVDGGDRADAETAMEEAIDARFAEPEKAIAVRANSLANGIMQEADDRDVAKVRDSDTGDLAGVVSSGPADDINFQDYTFLDGETFEVIGRDSSGSDSGLRWDPFNLQDNDSEFNEYIVTEPDPDDYEDVDPEEYDLDHVQGYQKLVDGIEYEEVVEEIYSEHEATLEEVESLLQTHYDGIEAGDLSLADMLSTGAMLDVVSEADSWQEAALYFRTLGLPEATEPTIISLDTSEVEDFDVDRSEFEGRLAWSIPTEVEDNEIPVGSEIDPEAYPGQFYYAAEWEDEETGEMKADVTGLNAPFTVEHVNGGDDFVFFEEREMATADTDPEEASRIFRENRESEEVAREQTIDVVLEDDGDDEPILGGIFSGDSGIGSVGIIAGLAAIIYALGASNN